MAGDIAISFAPPQAGAPWAAVKAVLNIPVKHIEQMAALAGTIQWFTRIVRRGQVYEYLYNATTTDEQAVSNLHDALLDLYIAAMELLARSDALFRSGVVKQTLNAILRPEQASGLVSDLLKKEQKVSMEAQSCEASRNSRAGMKMDERIEGLLARLNELSPPLTRIDEGVAKLLELVDKDRLEKLMDFISSEQFGKGHATIKDTRTKNTGDWLIHHEGFRDWQAIPSSSTLLCLKGTVGTGKACLTSRVIDHVKNALETSVHDEGFAFFYCNRSGPAMQDPLIILRSFVRQLSHKACDYDYIQSSLIQKCHVAKREGRDLSYSDCKELILDSLNFYSKTTIILDALDESDIMSHNLAEILIDMMEKATKPVKVFISSRPDREYLEAFGTRCTITVDSSNQQGDIEKFLDENVYSTKFFKEYKQEIQGEIKETFRSQNGGMFRWVYLQAKRLLKCKSGDAIKTWAKTIPRDLMGAYDQLWDNIREQHYDDDIALAERAIKWVLCSFEPLSSEILLEAIRYTFEGDIMVQKEKQTERQILLLCQDFLTIDAERRVWMLPHASVAEYFESRDLILGKCDMFVSKISLNFLMESKLEDIEYKFPYDPIASFDEYVALNWFMHVQRYDNWLGLEGADPNQNLVVTLKRFLGLPEESSDYYRKWVVSFSRDSAARKELIPSNMALFVICRYGFYYVLRDWWQKDKISEEMALKKNEESLNSLQLAARGGCTPIFRYLVSVINLSDPHTQGHYWAKQEAIDKGHKDIISVLVLEANIDVNSCYEGMTFVEYAASYRPDLLQWLVDQGWVDVNRESDSNYGTPLIAAARYGKLASMEILLKAGANVNAVVKCGNWGTALSAAAASPPIEGYLERVQVLLDNGAAVNQLGRNGSVLYELTDRARMWLNDDEIFATYRKSLELLLKIGADPTMIFGIGDHGSALAMAAFYGSKEHVEMMIDATEKNRAIECLRQSRYPWWWWKKYTMERGKHRAETRAYLIDQVGVDIEIIHRIGLGDVEHKELEDVEHKELDDGGQLFVDIYD
ncbi:hypothetical protein V8C37DRAFT_374734 [Trichoderma ceciliae]